MYEALLDKKEAGELKLRDPQKFRGLPSISLPAICALDDYLTRDMRVFEWGSGSSTRWFATRAFEVVSIEHNPEWFKTVEAALDYWGLMAARLLIEPQKGLIADFCSHQQGYETVNFKMYAESITIFPDEHFDVILVDGRARCACLRLAQAKLKVGGLLVLDDAARMIYQWAVQKIEWPRMALDGCIPYQRHGHTVQTMIWVKEA
jgi:hypothetical protein